MEDIKPPPDPWTEQLKLHQTQAKREELQIKVRAVLNVFPEVEDEVKTIHGDCNKVVENIKKGGPFTECSSYLQSLDDKVTIFRHRLMQLQMGLSSQIEVTGRYEGRGGGSLQGLPHK